MNDNDKVKSTSIYVDVKNCARCDQDHVSLMFTKFTNPIDDWTHFSICPYNKEPILLKVEYRLASEQKS